jgi:hypothetical protein
VSWACFKQPVWANVLSEARLQSSVLQVVAPSFLCPRPPAHPSGAASRRLAQIINK